MSWGYPYSEGKRVVPIQVTATASDRTNCRDRRGQVPYLDIRWISR